MHDVGGAGAVDRSGDIAHAGHAADPFAHALDVDPHREDVVDRHRRNPFVSFQPVHPPKPGRGRTHIDVSVPADQAEARVAAAIEAGGRLADASHAPHWWTLASPENHGVDIAAWPDVEDNADG